MEDRLEALPVFPKNRPEIRQGKTPRKASQKCPNAEGPEGDPHDSGREGDEGADDRQKSSNKHGECAVFCIKSVRFFDMVWSKTAEPILNADVGCLINKD